MHYRVLGVLVIFLLIGCNKDIVETAVSTTIVPTLAANVTIQRPPATHTPVSISASPAPTSTPTMTALSPILSAIINDSEQLSVKQSFDLFSIDYVFPDNDGSAVLVIDNFQKDVEVRDYKTNQMLFHLPDSPYVIAGNTIIQVLANEQQATLTAYDLFTGAILWEQSLPSSDWGEPIVVGNSILFINNDGFGSMTSTVHLFDQVSGNGLWQNQISIKCYSSLEVIELQNTIHISCFEDYFVLDKTTGELVSHYEFPEETNLSNIRVVGNKLYLLRKVWEDNGDGYKAENSYLQSVGIKDLENVFWQKQLDYGVYSFEVVEEDIIYRVGNQVVRINGRSGDLVWETELLTHLPAGMLIVDQWVFVGSGNGYLHLLDTPTGEIVWEQDIWATLNPRPIRVNPIVWTGSSLFVYADYQIIELGFDGKTNWQITQAYPHSTPVPVPTQTPFPILPTIAPSTALQPPPEMENWPAYILTYLNSPETAPDKLELLLTGWLVNEQSANQDSAIIVEPVDLNGDQMQDLIVNINNWPGWVLVFLQTSLDQYEIAWAQQATTPQVLAVIDLNNDGLTDFVYIDIIYGASQSTVTIYPVGWQQGELKELSTASISSTNVWVEDIQVEDVDDDGFIDIIFRGGTYGSATAGPNRESTFTYAWNGNSFELVSQKPILPQLYFFFLVEANQLLTSGKFEEAIDLYKESLDTEDALYYYNPDHQRAFAEFQIMLAYLLLNDEASASVYAENGNYQDQLYGEVKQIFWETYQTTGIWSEAAEAARKRVRLAGYQNAQLVDWVGYANSSLGLNDIVPCDECLQGTIGSDFGP